jgi:hypothetical protein
VYATCIKVVPLVIEIVLIVVYNLGQINDDIFLF